MPAVEVPVLCNIQYLSRKGWVDTGDVALLHPENVVPRYREKGKFVKVTITANGQVFVADDVPTDPTVLVPSDTRVPKLPEPDKTCPLCETEHLLPWDGTCLL